MDTEMDENDIYINNFSSEVNAGNEENPPLSGLKLGDGLPSDENERRNEEGGGGGGLDIGASTASAEETEGEGKSRSRNREESESAGENSYDSGMGSSSEEAEAEAKYDSPKTRIYSEEMLYLMRLYKQAHPDTDEESEDNVGLTSVPKEIQAAAYSVSNSKEIEIVDFSAPVSNSEPTFDESEKSEATTSCSTSSSLSCTDEASTPPSIVVQLTEPSEMASCPNVFVGVSSSHCGSSTSSPNIFGVSSPHPGSPSLNIFGVGSPHPGSSIPPLPGVNSSLPRSKPKNQFGSIKRKITLSNAIHSATNKTRSPTPPRSRQRPSGASTSVFYPLHSKDAKTMFRKKSAKKYGKNRHQNDNHNHTMPPRRPNETSDDDQQPIIHGIGNKTKCRCKCGETFISKKHLRQHIKCHQKAPFNCLHCPNDFWTYCNLCKHIMSNHLNLDMGTALELEDYLGFGCYTCGQIFPTEHDHKSHQDSEHPHPHRNLGRTIKSKYRLKQELEAEKKKAKLELKLLQLPFPTSSWRCFISGKR